jgi:hypothetical protein
VKDGHDPLPHLQLVQTGRQLPGAAPPQLSASLGIDVGAEGKAIALTLQFLLWLVTSLLLYRFVPAAGLRLHDHPLASSVTSPMPTESRTSTAAPATSVKSTSFPRAAGRKMGYTDGGREPPPERTHPRSRPEEDEEADEANRTGRRPRSSRSRSRRPPPPRRRREAPRSPGRRLARGRRRFGAPGRRRRRARWQAVPARRERDRRCRRRAGCSLRRRTSSRRSRRLRSVARTDPAAAGSEGACVRPCLAGRH